MEWKKFRTHLFRARSSVFVDEVLPMGSSMKRTNEATYSAFLKTCDGETLYTLDCTPVTFSTCAYGHTLDYCLLLSHPRTRFGAARSSSEIVRERLVGCVRFRYLDSLGRFCL